MPPLNQPKTLFALAKDTISDLIFTNCWEIIYRYEDNEGNLAYDTPECAASIQILHDALLNFIPPPMCNFICEATLSFNDNRKFKIYDQRILYGVLINENVTSLKVHGEEYKEDQTESFGIENVIPSMKNIVKLDLSHVYSDDLLAAISNTCEKLEDLKLHHQTSEAAFRSFVNKCSKLRIITCLNGFQPQENLMLAVTSLPNLEYLEYRGVAEVLNTAKDLGPLKLQNIDEFEATPRNVIAAFTLCPYLQELTLAPYQNELSSEILDILAASPLKMKRLSLYMFNLTNASAEKFFNAKGEHIAYLRIALSEIPEELNFIKFIGMTCTNLEEISLFQLNRPFWTDGEHYLYNISKNPSFDKLKDIEVCHIDSPFGQILESDRKITATIALLVAKSLALEKISVELPRWTGGYPSPDEIKQIFSVERIRNVTHLDFNKYEMPKRIVRYFLANTPNLTHFTVPTVVKFSALILIEQLRKRARAMNLNLTFRFENQNDDFYDSEEESGEDDASKADNDEGIDFVNEDMTSDSEDDDD